MTAKWLLGLALVTACGFGDNGSLVQSSRNVCGDGVVDATEGCDDGNNVSGDGCSDTCAAEVANPVCGNGTREVGEACDDGNAASGDGCSSTCVVESVCGNGTRETGEACDDGNIASGDGCSPTCQTETATACSLVPQGGCSGATPACDIVSDDGDTGCRAVTVMGTENSHCETDSECKAGYTCLGDSDPTHDPWCGRFCITDSNCSGIGSRCLIDLVDSQGDPLNIKVCTNTCNPYTQSGCPTGMGCLGFIATAGDYSDCRYMGTTPDEQSCTKQSDCQPGSACVNTGGVAVCRAYCIVGDDDTCGLGEECVAFGNGMNIGTVEYGSCF